MEITITNDNFENEVLKSDKPVLVDFLALTVLLVPLTPRAPSLLSQNILVYPSGSRYPKSTVCPL